MWLIPSRVNCASPLNTMSGSTPIPRSLTDVICSANTDCKVKIFEVKSMAVQLQVY
jgi:hypothetical protein